MRHGMFDTRATGIHPWQVFRRLMKLVVVVTLTLSLGAHWMLLQSVAWVGVAYSRFLSSRITLDTSFQYTLRTEANNFRLGDRIDGGLALAYRFTEDIQKFPQVHAFAEANVRYLFKSKEDGASDPNTGGTAVFLTPGVRVFFTPNVAFTVSAPLPVLQDLNGEQLKTAF